MFLKLAYESSKTGGKDAKDVADEKKDSHTESEVFAKGMYDLYGYVHCVCSKLAHLIKPIGSSECCTVSN